MPQKWARPQCNPGERCHIGSSTIVEVRWPADVPIPSHEATGGSWARLTPFKLLHVQPHPAQRLRTACAAMVLQALAAAAAAETPGVLQGLWDRIGSSMDWSLGVHAYGPAGSREWPQSFTFSGARLPLQR